MLVLAAVQTSLLDAISVWGATPDFFLVFAIFCGMHFKGNAGVGMGFLTGWIQDCLSGGLLGVNTLSKSLVSFFFSALKDKIMVEGWIPVGVFIMVASLFDGLVFYGIWSMLLGNEMGGRFIPVFIGSAVYNAAVGPALFFIFNLQKKWVGKKFPTPLLSLP
jgi:rod shape-determining protein MreD